MPAQAKVLLADFIEAEQSTAESQDIWVSAFCPRFRFGLQYKI
jgi:hypothetical protein